MANEDEFVHGGVMCERKNGADPAGLGGKQGTILESRAVCFFRPPHPALATCQGERTEVNFFIDNWTVFAIAIVSAAMLLWPVVAKGARAGGVGVNDAVMLMNREKAVVVDVCEPSEFANGHVLGAKNIPLSQLEAKLTGAVKNKATPVILVCASGIRSNRAVSVATKLGYERAVSLSGGMGAWREASLPVEKG
jgi:rhodanese-related sulfurtransferase